MTDLVDVKRLQPPIPAQRPLTEARNQSNLATMVGFPIFTEKEAEDGNPFQFKFASLKKDSGVQKDGFSALDFKVGLAVKVSPQAQNALIEESECEKRNILAKAEYLSFLGR